MLLGLGLGSKECFEISLDFGRNTCFFADELAFVGWVGGLLDVPVNPAVMDDLVQHVVELLVLLDKGVLLDEAPCQDHVLLVHQRALLERLRPNHSVLVVKRLHNFPHSVDLILIQSLGADGGKHHEVLVDPTLFFFCKWRGL